MRRWSKIWMRHLVVQSTRKPSELKPQDENVNRFLVASRETYIVGFIRVFAETHFGSCVEKSCCTLSQYGT